MATNLLRLGTITPAALKVGAGAALKAYQGTTLVWDPSVAPGVITLVANAGATSPTATNVATAAIDTTGATLLVVVVSQSNGAAFGTLSDSKGNTTWTALTPQNVGMRETISYVTNPTVGTGHTVTYTSSATDYPSICVAAFGGVATATPLDQQVGSSTDGVLSLTPGSVTPTQANALVISGLANNQPGSFTITGGFTITNEAQHTAGLNYGSALAYLIQTTAITANPTWSRLEPSALAGTNASFKAAT
jgi:hypothetical protein